MARNFETHKTSRLLMVAAVIVLIWGLQFAKEVLVPLALATLFSFLLAPLVARLERWRLNRVASVLTVVSLTFIVFGIVGYIVAIQLKEIGGHWAEYQVTIQQKVTTVASRVRWVSKASSAVQQMTHQPTTTPASMPAAAAQNPGGQSAQVVVERAASNPESSLTLSAFTPILGFAATTFVVIVLVVFMLLERDDLRDRVIRLSGAGRMNVTTQAMKEASGRVSKYLLMQSLINGSYGAVVTIALWAFHVQAPLLWGIMFALLRFIPYAGPFMGAALPCLLSLAMPGNAPFFKTISLFIICEIIVSSWIEPWLYGSHTGVSSVAILVAAVFWAWLWGGVGLLLATPLTVVLVVIGKYIPQLEFLNVMLGDEKVFEPHTRYYQRLLASDQEEAEEVVEEDLRVKPIEEVYETVLIPALAMAELARDRERIDADRANYIRQHMKELIIELGERPPAPPTPKTDEEKAVNAKWKPVAGAGNVKVLCLPARDEADEIAGMMFAQVLSRAGFKAEAVSVTPLASEMLEMVEKRGADIVVISALPPAAVTHARYLCKRLHAKFPKLNVVVGLWTLRSDLGRAKERIGCAQTNTIAGNFFTAINEMQQLVHPLLLRGDNPQPETNNQAATRSEQGQVVAAV